MDDTAAVRCAMDCAPPNSDASDSLSDIPADAVPEPETDRQLPVLISDQTAAHEPPPEGDTGQRAGGNGQQPASEAPDAETAPSPEQIIEALLFASDGPVSAARLAEIVGSCTPGAVRRLIDALNDKYARAGLSFRIEPIARGYQMLTLPRFHEWIARLHQQRQETRLSPAALETLAIIAYQQPVIRADIEAIRGVACGEVIARLRDMGLVRVVGRAEVVGRPLLYGTTRKFLEVFGLADLNDLPPLEALELRRPQPTGAEPQQPAAETAA